MGIGGMKIALPSCREVVQSLSCTVIEGEGNELRKIAWNEEANFAGSEPVISHPSFVRQMMHDVCCRTAFL
jgi:hypothetical protein